MDPYNEYILMKPHEGMDYLVLIVLVIVLGSVFFTANFIVKKLNRSPISFFRSLMFMGTILLVLNGIRLLYPSKFGMNVLINAHGRTNVYGALLLCALFFFMLVKKYFRTVIAISLFCIRVLSPLVVVFFSLAIWSSIHSAGIRQDKEIMPKHSVTNNENRVIVLLFDELDQSQLFENRDKSLQLLELDDFKKKSFYATNAFPPAGRTIESMPSIINGRIVTAVKFVNHSEIRLKYEGSSEYVSWTDQENIFRTLYKEGFNTALIGWFHPYSRVLKGLNYNKWFGMVPSPSGGFFVRMLDQANALLHMTPGSRLSFGENAKSFYLHCNNYEQMRKDAVSLAADPHYNLVFTH